MRESQQMQRPSTTEGPIHPAADQEARANEMQGGDLLDLGANYPATPSNLGNNLPRTDMVPGLLTLNQGQQGGSTREVCPTHPTQ